MTILRFLKSFSLVFPCRNENPRTNFYIFENNTISTYHELNLSRLWGIPRGKNVNWKIARKCDICILKYWLFPKAFSELQNKWNGSVLNLNHSSIPQTKNLPNWYELAFFCAFHEQNPFASTRGTDFRQFTATNARFSEFSMFFLYFDVQL